MPKGKDSCPRGTSVGTSWPHVLWLQCEVDSVAAVHMPASSGEAARFSAAAAHNITCAAYASDYPRYPPRDTPAQQDHRLRFRGASTPAGWLIAPDAWLAGRYRLLSGDAGLLSGAVSG